MQGHFFNLVRCPGQISNKKAAISDGLGSLCEREKKRKEQEYKG
jgi:hypothetical protein